MVYSNDTHTLNFNFKEYDEFDSATWMNNIKSFSEKSSLTAYPNTEGSARLHKVYELLEMQRKPKNEENNLSEFTDNNSARSIKSVEEKKGKKIY